jgi:signal transduction histidine kinase
MPTRLLLVLFTFLVVLGAIAGVAAFKLANAYESFGARIVAVQGRASLLVEQHDALLTALDAVVVSGDETVFNSTARAIRAAYPRLVSIMSTSSPKSGLVAGAAGQYRLTASNGQQAVELTIDAADLLGDDMDGIVANLAMPDGTLLIGPSIDDPEFTGLLASDSQPLVLSATLVPNWWSMLPLWPTAMAGALALAFYGLAIVTWRQWHYARRAERRALQGENLARLEHASRINGLGEMASGIAHELTQPLTAILSQAQAGRRLLARGDLASLGRVLDETITQTKRASSILGKLRQWVRLEGYQPAKVSVRGAVDSVESLVRGDLLARGYQFEQIHADSVLSVRADAVQLEQVIFNLVRNAIDAIGNETGKIVVSTRRDGDTAVIEVMDNGPGLDERVKAHLFEPFVTSKANGMGLGLALCRRLVERMGGSLNHIEGVQTTFSILLPAYRDAR